MGGLELASLIRQLRAELNEAMDEAEGERLRFELGPVELSLTVTVGREAAPGAKRHDRTMLHQPPQTPGSSDLLPELLPKEAAQRS